MPDQTPTPRCPRCSIALDAFTRHAIGDDARPPVVADMCRRCSGVWYDASEVEVANAALARVHAQPDEVFRGGDRGAAPCPRCAAAMRQFGYVALELDGRSAGGEGCDPLVLRREWGAWSFFREVGGALGSMLLAVLGQRYCPQCGRLVGTCLHT